jgi:integrase
VDLRGLAEGARLEVLYGLEGRARAERRTPPWVVQLAVNRLNAEHATSVFDIPIDHLYADLRLFFAFTRDQVTLAMTTPEAEMVKDEWDLRVFGRRGERLHFSQIHQLWLKETAKAWAAERLDTVARPTVLGRVLHAVGMFSTSLRRHRPDGGTHPGALSRADLLAFSADLSHLETVGEISHSNRQVTLRGVDQLLREARGIGLGRPGGPLEGLPADVVWPADRTRSHQDPDDECRALPQVVVDQLLAPAALDTLESAHGADLRAMIELQALVGRRTGELCALRYDCLAFDEVTDEAGRARPAPVLVHDMPKVAIRNYRLPIDESAAEIIRAQQARVGARYPDAPASQLALFPAVEKNPRGVKPVGTDYLVRHMRRWIDSLPELLGSAGEACDRAEITPYSLRHSYAQRHADNGTPVDVLAELMGHRRLTTTQGYFNVTNKRKRKAVDLLAAMQVDRGGGRSRPAVDRLLDSEALRDSVGQVAVPFGICREPTNVKAHGQACPFRHQCFGCVHFRSDPSFLPELRAYLNRLLADRERLRAVAPELEEWARNSAIPSAEEITAVRQLIDRCENLLADLPDGERVQIDEAITTLRRHRAQLDSSVPVRFLGRISQPSPALFPNVRREARRDQDE